MLSRWLSINEEEVCVGGERVGKEVTGAGPKE